MWKKIVTEAKDANLLGNAFDISCGNHGNKAKVLKPEDEEPRRLVTFMGRMEMSSIT